MRVKSDAKNKTWITIKIKTFVTVKENYIPPLETVLVSVVICVTQ
jgi:hypothetical protein